MAYLNSADIDWNIPLEKLGGYGTDQYTLTEEDIRRLQAGETMIIGIMGEYNLMLRAACHDRDDQSNLPQSNNS
jgi:hypothetical protein